MGDREKDRELRLDDLEAAVGGVSRPVIDAYRPSLTHGMAGTMADLQKETPAEELPGHMHVRPKTAIN